jgi:MFS family permease
VANAKARTKQADLSLSSTGVPIGPIAGGYLTERTWRAIFWINVPAWICIAAGLALIAGFVLYELRAANPLMRIRTC